MEKLIKGVLYTFIFICVAYCLAFGVLGFYNANNKICSIDKFDFSVGSVYSNAYFLNESGNFFIQYYDFNQIYAIELDICFYLEANTTNGIILNVIDEDKNILDTLYVVNGSKQYCSNIHLNNECNILEVLESVNKTLKYGDNYTGYHWDYMNDPPTCSNPTAVECVNLFHIYETNKKEYKNVCYNDFYGIGLLVKEKDILDYVYVKSTTSGEKTQQVSYDNIKYTNAKSNPLVIDYYFKNSCKSLTRWFLISYMYVILAFGFVLLLSYGFVKTEEIYEDMSK